MEDLKMRRLQHLLFVPVILLVNLFCMNAARAQEARGTISGVVKDSNGGVLVGARVEIQPTGKYAVTDDQGQFRISDVPAGQYTVTVSYVGFAPFSTSMTVSPGQVAATDIALKVASESDQMVVTAERLQGET